MEVDDLNSPSANGKDHANGRVELNGDVASTNGQGGMNCISETNASVEISAISMLNLPYRDMVERVDLRDQNQKKKVSNFVKLEEIYYAGKYRSDITDEKGNQYIIFRPVENFSPAIKAIKVEMEEGINDIPGSLIEDNRYCLSIHYRHVNEKDLSTLHKRVQLILKNWSKFHTTEGIKVTEIRPSIKWDKDDALKYLLETFMVISNSNKDLIPIYIALEMTEPMKMHSRF